MYLVCRYNIMIGLCHKCLASGVSVVLNEETSKSLCTDCHNKSGE